MSKDKEKITNIRAFKNDAKKINILALTNSIEAEGPVTSKDIIRMLLENYENDNKKSS